MSAGHVVDAPEQTSCGSQIPADARHTVPVLPATWVQLPLVQASTVQGLLSLQSAAVVQVGVFSANVRLFRLNPAAISKTRRTWLPAGRVTLFLVTVVQVVHDPVEGTAMAPVRSAVVSSSMRNEPPPAIDAVRAVMLYVPPVMFTLYRSHSPAAVQPMLNPPP